MIFSSHPQVPGATFATNGAAEYAVFDATVYRLREMVLAYTFPASLVNKLNLTAVTFSVSGRNLWFLAPNTPKYTNIDPDFNSVVSANNQGVESGGAPSTRRIGVNLNITFIIVHKLLIMKRKNHFIYLFTAMVILVAMPGCKKFLDVNKNLNSPTPEKASVSYLLSSC